MSRILFAALILGSSISPALAAPHLGMKLACKHYGEAWNSGSRGQLYGQITGDFASVFQRMPDHMFANMPRGGSGKVLSSSKGSGVGHVTVATPHGVMTFTLVGRGFNWTVADIQKRGDDGRPVSLKSYLDASVTSHEFITDLRNRGGSSFHDSITSRFRHSFHQLSQEELDIVRAQLPPISRDIKPYLSMNGRTALMTVRLPNQRVARLSLVREGSWKVDDYGVESPTMSIASFRNSLGTIVAITRFRQFMVNPINSEPETFTVAGQLRDSLNRVQQIGHLPLNQKPSNLKRCTIDATGRHVHIALEDSRQVRLVVQHEPAGARIAKVDVTLGKQWADLGHLIALNDRARGALAIVGVRQPVLPAAAVVAKAPAPAPSVLEPASAKIIEKPAVASIARDAKVRPAVASQDSSPTIRRVSYAQYSAPRTIYRARKPGLFRRFSSR